MIHSYCFHLDYVKSNDTTPTNTPTLKKADALTVEPPGFAIYLKQPMGKIYPPLEHTDFQGTMTNNAESSRLTLGNTVYIPSFKLFSSICVIKP